MKALKPILALKLQAKRNGHWGTLNTVNLEEVVEDTSSTAYKKAKRHLEVLTMRWLENWDRDLQTRIVAVYQ